MHSCILDGNKIMDRAMLHDALANALGFPDWYGRNLDALYDCLTDRQEPTEIRLLHREALEARLGRYSKAFERVMRDACLENPNICYDSPPENRTQ